MLQVIDAVVEHLKASFDLAVEYFPESPDKYRLNHPVGSLLVSYPGSTFERVDDAATIVQTRYVHMSVTVVARQLNGRSGAVDIAEHTLGALVGFAPPACSKFAATGVKFLGSDKGLWQYAVDVAASTLLVESADDDDAAAGVIKRITFVGGITDDEEIHVPRAD